MDSTAGAAGESTCECLEGGVFWEVLGIIGGAWGGMAGDTAMDDEDDDAWAVGRRRSPGVEMVRMGIVELNPDIIEALELEALVGKRTL